ncbi:MAG: hypothetical protein EON91_12295 [Brevundimonas sp.]|uniref:hypothetical protein n=1 Tax=Brevundimonas sp. TaxID=1871086 RepID=UPI00122BC794|nr:hypothetical protein [Brevundimonas sp.]RZJ16650.1 MAG: hypothetical protein EON91_12295 [Brevundimonas sp.]
MRAVTVLILATLAAFDAAAQTQTPEQRLSEIAGALLQADGPRARSLLVALPSGELEPKFEAFRTCAAERLDLTRALPAPPADAPFALQALHAYRLYWREAIDRPEARDQAEIALARRLGALLDRPELDDMLEAEEPTLERIRAEGWRPLGGRTGRLLELMLWRQQEAREVSVALPEGSYPTTLILLDGFESRGWSNWITCDRTGTGGWAKPEGLYAIVPAYPSLEDENFSVNFLAHETQHFADYAAWPGLPGWELEYRAKLAELALADTTRERILNRFESNQGDDQADAHSHANRRVLAALRRRLDLPADADLKTVAPDALRAAALAELRADTADRPEPANRIRAPY